MNAPIPSPLTVLVLSAMVGFGLLSHTIPRTVTGDAPMATTFPPEVAALVVMEVAAAVVSCGIGGVKTGGLLLSPDVQEKIMTAVTALTKMANCFFILDFGG